MRKLAFLTVALLPLLGGCVSSTCDYPTTTIQWKLQNYDGSQRGCLAASGTLDPDIAWVDAYIGTASPVRASCSDGAMVIDTSRFAPGTYPATVEGIGTDGVSIYDRAQFNLTVSECGNTAYYPVLGESLLNVDYHFSPDVCHGGYMWFALYDEVAQGYISVVDVNSAPAWKEYYGCYSTAGGTPLAFAVPFGTYTLDWIQEVVNPLTAPDPVQQACRQPSIEARVIGTVDYPVTLAPYVAACL
jgi:hypothetical protein